MKIEVPTSWEAISLKKYQAINALFKESKSKGESLKDKAKELHDYNTECALISLLTDTDMDEILSLNRSAHNRHNEQSYVPSTADNWQGQDTHPRQRQTVLL
jgi:hypothetical protein